MNCDSRGEYIFSGCIEILRNKSLDEVMKPGFERLVQRVADLYDLSYKSRDKTRGKPGGIDYSKAFLDYEEEKDGSGNSGV
ncbi:hypothetical protein AGMMS49944_03730 [Spirochaetia bacterium]|nr:hypothetical protein AGMMS49944_03730 [Spirochaetia bacterium]